MIETSCWQGIMTDTSLSTFDDKNFADMVLSRQGVTVVDFWSTTCSPCRQLTKILCQLRAYVPDDVLIGQVDADKNPGLMRQFGVRSLPTLLFIRNGNVVETRIGVDRMQVLKKIIETHARD